MIVVNAPLHGTFAAGPADDGSFTYTPIANFSGTDRFTYYLQANGVDSNVATVTIAVSTVAVTPIAQDDAYTTNENTALNVAASGVLDNDIDPNGNAMSAMLQTGPSHGTLHLNADGSFGYTPNANYSGPDSFTYLAFDGKLESNVATVALTVVPIVVPPTSTNAGFAMQEDDRLDVPAPGILGSAVDPQGRSLQAVLVNPTLEGSLELNPDGSFSYTPGAGFSGTDTFTFRASDGPMSSTLSTVTIAVGAVPTTTVQLAPGTPDQGGFTNDPTPMFAGTALPGLQVVLYGQSAGGTPLDLGRATSDASGRYAVTSQALPDGTYNFWVDTVRPNGMSIGAVGAGALTVDTAPPRITNVFIVPRTGQIMVTFQDGASGMNLASITDPANYSFTRRAVPSPRSFVITSATLVPPASDTGAVTVALTSSVGKPIPRGHYLFEIFSGGILDVAGNRLDGLFIGAYPTGGGGPGSDFDAMFLSRDRRPRTPVTTRHFVPVITQDRRAAITAVRVELARVRPAGPLALWPAPRLLIAAARLDRRAR